MTDKIPGELRQIFLFLLYFVFCILYLYLYLYFALCILYLVFCICIKWDNPRQTTPSDRRNRRWTRLNSEKEFHRSLCSGDSHRALFYPEWQVTIDSNILLRRPHCAPSQPFKPHRGAFQKPFKSWKFPQDARRAMLCNCSLGFSESLSHFLIHSNIFAKQIYITNLGKNFSINYKILYPWMNAILRSF